MSDGTLTPHVPATGSLATAMSRSLSGMLNGEFSAALQDAFRPLLEEAFRRGLRVGVEMAKNASDNAIDAILTVDVGDGRQTSFLMEVKKAPPPRHGTSNRAPPGAVRPIVELALQDRPGARMIEIQNVAKMLDAGISPSSISNELNRHLGTRYRREDGRWFLFDGLGKANPSQADSLSYTGRGAALVGEDGTAADRPSSPALQIALK